jgi:hypothetical protein
MSTFTALAGVTAIQTAGIEAAAQVPAGSAEN